MYNERCFQVISYIFLDKCMYYMEQKLGKACSVVRKRENWFPHCTSILFTFIQRTVYNIVCVVFSSFLGPAGKVIGRSLTVD